MVVIFMLTIWWIARSLNQIDYARTKAENTLKKERENLEITVKKRTEELSRTNKLLEVEIKEHEKSEKKLEKTVAELERSNKDLEQFAYIASHDLQEPLRSVSGFLQLLSRRYHGKLDSKADQYIDIAVGGANRMQTMIEDLLKFSRVTTRGEKFKPTNFETVLSDVLLNLKVSIDENNASITHDPLPTVMADESQMKQVLQNLISNAIKFHSEETHPKIHLSAEEKNQEWIFSVKDNGIGIDPKYAERVFEVFKRLHTRQKYPGTGIGLAVGRKIIERHGGRIWVNSKLGEGSTFHFSIPRR
jgi:light-regulated signal transduction histidine kinase (bacteriophytochrome)